MQELQKLQKRIQELEAQLVHYKSQWEKDSLTGCLRRDAFHERLKQLDNTQSWSVIIIDIDHFKRINDSFGHDTGDHVIASLGRTLQKHLPPGGLCARWGGEEFVMLVPLSLASARFLAESLRRWVQQKASPTPFTISAGVELLRSSQEFTESLAQADKKLYQAKASGRNQVAA